MALKKWNENYKIWLQKPNTFSRTGKKIEEIKKALSYELPKAEKVVRLKGSEGVEELRNEKYINEDNFRLQIGKMQKDGKTIYSPLMLKFGLEYIADHINTDEEGKSKAIIQLRPDLAQCLLQDDKEILSFEEEKEEIEKLIKKTLGKKGKFIEIQNVADNYPDVFNAIKNGRKGIIPSKEPILENIKLPLESPLPIIKFLAYHAKNDPNLMDVFYKTKPDKYIGQDTKKGLKPGDSDADYYSIVEVGIRLFEVLNGISIQGGIGRQRVYDKIIGLILFGKDKIGAEDYGINGVLKLKDYPALNNLHTRLIGSGIYNDVRMNQLYIELNENSIDKFKEGLDKKKRYKSKLRKLGTGLALAGALTFGGVKSIDTAIEHNKQKKVDYAYTEREATQSSNPEGTLYLEETNELIIAIGLDELKDDNVKQTIIDLFNIYVGNHKNDGFTNPELIQGFWQEYGGMLIKDFKLSHSPYDFMDTDTIELTNNIPDELVFTPDYRFGNKVSSKDLYNDYGAFQGDTHYVKSRHGKALRYNDNGKPYIIIKAHVYIGNTKTFIYLATDEVNKHYPYFSTDMVKKIQDQSGLDPEILSNTNNLKHDLTFENRVDFTGVAYPTDHIVRLINTNEDQVVMMNERMKKSPSASGGTILLTPKTVYLENGGLYYVITVATKSGKKIGLASKSLDEPFTTTIFNKLSKEFSKVRGVGYDKTIYITKKPT